MEYTYTVLHLDGINQIFSIPAAYGVRLRSAINGPDRRFDGLRHIYNDTFIFSFTRTLRGH